jgi:hypothetical protein
MWESAYRPETPVAGKVLAANEEHPMTELQEAVESCVQESGQKNLFVAMLFSLVPEMFPRPHDLKAQRTLIDVAFSRTPR